MYFGRAGFGCYFSPCCFDSIVLMPNSDSIDKVGFD
jgi:hypothetical protein